MEIFGLEKLSLVDYDGKVACTIFTGACNFNCGFCHNAPLVKEFKNLPKISDEEVFEYLREQKELLEPDYWRIKIQEENKLKWMFIKWACAVRFARNKYSNENIFSLPKIL